MEADLPLVSIVTPSLNQGSFIGAALESVAAQDYPSIEHIVMDGGSTDDTAEVVRPYLDRISWVSEADDGQSDALNRGFARASGSILAWLNTDDALLPGAVRRAVEALEAAPDVAFACGTLQLRDSGGNDLWTAEPPRGWGLHELRLYHDFVNQPTAFFRREALDAAGGLRDDLHYAMDWDLFLRLADHGGMIILEGEPLATATLHPAMKSARGGTARFREIVSVVHEHSGRRVTPGTLVYALEWAEALIRSALSPLRPGADKIYLPTTDDRLARAHRRLLTAIGLRMPKPYDDGWAGPRIRATLLPGSGEVIVEGSIPDWCPLEQQTLTVEIDREVQYEEPVGPGWFTLRLPYASDRPVMVKVTASESFRGPSDGRRLSWAAASIRWL